MLEQPLLAVVVRFARELRAAGLGVSSGQVEAFGRSLAWVGLESRREVYHAARTTLLTRAEERALFDRLFSRFWLGAEAASGAAKMPLAPRHRPRAAPAPLAMLLAERARADDPQITPRDRAGSHSPQESLQYKDFALMTPLELDALTRLLAAGRWSFAQRVTRRRVPSSSGSELDLRRVLARAARAGGAVLELPRRRPKIKPRPVVLLADVSGSMELYTRVLLQFMFVFGRRAPRVESFAFATRLTRITGELSLDSVDRALDEVSRSVVDFASGTRIADCLHVFNTAWAGRLSTRGAVTIIMSDGWERGSADQLKKEMRILRERCHRVIWLNPRLGHPGYVPRVEGMAAALDHIDDFLSCHSLRSLEALARHLEALPRRRGAARPLPAASHAAGGQA